MAFLMHHGVKGMKWGIRRFQNKDGTLTALGKFHLKETRQVRKIQKSATQGLAQQKVKDLPTSNPELVRKGQYWYNQNGEILATATY